MTPKIRILYYALWLAHPVLESTLAVLMVRRDLHRKFRYFFAYVLNQLVTFAILFWMYWHGNELTFYLYWGCQAVSAGFGFGVIHEVFVDVFRPFHTLRDLGSVLFKWAGLVMLLVAGVVSVSTDSPSMPPWMQAIVTTQRCVRIIQVGMVLFLIFFSQYVGISRRQRSFGVALGFGSFSMVELGLVASWAGHHLGNPWMSIVNMTAYNTSLVVWISYVAAKHQVRDAASTLLQTQRWEQSLSDIQHPVPANSLIPMFEGMVDRALSRTQPEPTHSTESARAAAASVGDFSAPPLRVPTRK